MDDQHESTTETVEQAKKNVPEELEAQYAVKIIEPAVVAAFGSEDGLFLKDISEAESQVYVNGEMRVIGKTCYQKVD